MSRYQSFAKGGCMGTIAEFSLDAGGSILVEVTESEETGILRQAGVTSEVVHRVTDTLESAVDKVRPAVSGIAEKFRSLKDSPNQVEVEFGMKLTTAAGAVIAAATTE